MTKSSQDIPGLIELDADGRQAAIDQAVKDMMVFPDVATRLVDNIIRAYLAAPKSEGAVTGEPNAWAWRHIAPGSEWNITFDPSNSRYAKTQGCEVLALYLAPSNPLPAMEAGEISLIEAQPPNQILMRLNEYVEARLAVRESSKQTYFAAEERVRAAYAALRDEFAALRQAPAAPSQEADRDSIRILKQFASMYRSGAQGAAMDFDAAQVLALAIDDILASPQGQESGVTKP